MTEQGNEVTTESPCVSAENVSQSESHGPASPNSMDFQLRHIERSSNRESKLTNKDMAEEEAPCYDFIDPVGYDWDCTPFRKGPPHPTTISIPKYFVTIQMKTRKLSFIISTNSNSLMIFMLISRKNDFTGLHKVTSQDCIDAAHVAVEEFNNLKGADLKFLKLLNVTSRITGGIFYFLTLQCTDERFYEAKIFITLEGARDLFMFRPAKHYPRPSSFVARMGARRNGDVAFSLFCSFSSSNNTRLGKHVHDNVHGNIYLDPLVLKFIDTEEFQRQVLVAPINGKMAKWGVFHCVCSMLRDLKQLGRFGILDPNVFAGSCDEVTSCKRLLEKVDLKGYQIGKTKVFLRAGQMAELDACRSEVLGRSASVIQRKVRSYLVNMCSIVEIEVQSFLTSLMGARRNGDVAFSLFCSFSSSNNTRLGKHVHDNVHGNIYLDPLVLKFIDIEEFQRQVLVAPINGKMAKWGVFHCVCSICDEVTACKRLLEKVDLKGYQIGKTKVFLRAGQMAELDACRSEVLGRSASVIQRKVRSYLVNRCSIVEIEVQSFLTSLMGARRNGDVAFSLFCSFSSSNNTRLGKHVHDNVHGNIYLDPLVLKFIDTEEFQRQVLVAPINGKMAKWGLGTSNNLGVMEAIRIICAGYTTRKPFREFVGRFGILDPNVFAGSCDEVTACKRLLEKVDLKGYQIGKNKVFLRAGQMAELDACRSEVLGRSASVIQRKVRSYLARKSFILLRVSSIQIQAFCIGLRDLLNSARLDNSSSNIEKSRFFIVNPTHLNQKFTLESGLIKYFQPELPNKSGSTNDEADFESSPVQLGLMFLHTEKYPDEPPLLNLTKGVSPNDLAYGMLPQGLRLSGTYTDIIVPPSSSVIGTFLLEYQISSEILPILPRGLPLERALQNAISIL
ncbi:hypothetical protein F8388_004255 [Cannabis sativa]|uniref:Myosin motor domain-containing protein n=1 Tax=Cannabis sativa TaxID=3483 RepID=A0A7J6F7A6_CANSA|nr:hypothetical protein F8388_004255 [Cannabis sativa]